jgi:glycosyltransferase involved in cell wall biosynthesis
LKDKIQRHNIDNSRLVSNLKCSVITVTYNCESTISYSLESVKNQTYKNIEHIVIDGSSHDRTMEILQSNKNYFKVLLSEKDEGIYDALNKGLKSATGDVIAVLHSDDFFINENVISDIMILFTINPEISIIMGNVEYVDNFDINKIIRLYKSSNFKLWMLRFGFCPAHTATFFRNNVFKKVGLYSNLYKVAGDYDFFVRTLWVHKLKYMIINKAIVRMRIGGASSSGIKSYLISTKEIYMALKSNRVITLFAIIELRFIIKLIKMLTYRMSSYIKLFF